MSLVVGGADDGLSGTQSYLGLGVTTTQGLQLEVRELRSMMGQASSLKFPSFSTHLDREKHHGHPHDGHAMHHFLQPCPLEDALQPHHPVRRHWLLLWLAITIAERTNWIGLPYHRSEGPILSVHPLELPFFILQIFLECLDDPSLGPGTWRNISKQKH